MNPKATRYPELDIWRGLAISGMIIFHIFYALNYFGLYDMAYTKGGWWVLGRSVQWSFLLLVGIGLQLSYQRKVAKGKTQHEFVSHMLVRIVFLYGCAVVISLMSFLAVGKFFVRFGIIHHIATALLILTPLVSRPVVALVLSATVYLTTPFITSIALPESPLLIFGIIDGKFASLDFFPLFPWLSISALGVFLGSLMFGNGERNYNVPLGVQSAFFNPLKAMGKRSLLIYMVHAPIIVMMIQLFLIIDQ